MNLNETQINAAMVFILIALIEAWVVVGRRYLKIEPLRKWIKADQDLIRSHIDFILMALLLLAFSRIDQSAPPFLVCVSIAGSFLNPILFLFCR